MASGDKDWQQRWTNTEAVKAAMAARPPAPPHPPAFEQCIQVGPVFGFCSTFAALQGVP
jgi:hypothetical protein